MLLRLPFFFVFSLLQMKKHLFFGFAFSFSPFKASPRALPAATARPAVDQVGRRVVRVLFCMFERRKRGELFFDAAIDVRLSTIVRRWLHVFEASLSARRN